MHSKKSASLTFAAMPSNPFRRRVRACRHREPVQVAVIVQKLGEVIRSLKEHGFTITWWSSTFASPHRWPAAIT